MQYLLFRGPATCIANQQALLRRYDFNMWQFFIKFKDLLPHDSRKEFSSLIEEEKTVPRASLQATLDAADSMAKSMATAVTMRRGSWLQSSELPQNTGITDHSGPPISGIFEEQTDPMLHGLQDS